MVDQQNGLSRSHKDTEMHESDIGTATVDSAVQKQLRTCLRLTGWKLGYLPMFGEAIVKDGTTRIVKGERCLLLRVSVSPRG